MEDKAVQNDLILPQRPSFTLGISVQVRFSTEDVYNFVLPLITISKQSKEGRHAPITLFRSTRALGVTRPAARPSVHWASSVLVERSLPSRFNKLPYVSICSTTGESELTFQSAAPCALWMHRPKVSTSASFITLNDRLTEWRPSVIAPQNTPLLFSPPSSAFSHQSPPFLKPSQVSPPSVAPLLSLLLLEVQQLALLNLRNNRQGSPAVGSTHFSAGCL